MCWWTVSQGGVLKWVSEYGMNFTARNYVPRNTGRTGGGSGQGHGTWNTE